MIRPRSTRMQKLMRAYRKEAQDWVMGEMILGKPATEVHHIRGRLGTLLFDKRFWVAVNRKTHDWIRDNPEKARYLGFLCKRGEWNVAPKDAETERIRQRMIEICKS